MEILRVALETIYLVPAAALTKNVKEALLYATTIAIARLLFLSYAIVVRGRELRSSAGFRALVLVSAVFLSLYFGLPSEESSIIRAFFVAYPALFDRPVAAAFALATIFVRPVYISGNDLEEVLVHAEVSGAPIIILLAGLPELRHVALLLLLYRLFLSIPLDRPAFFYTRLALSYFLALYAYREIPGGFYVIAKAFVRPATIGSEAIRFSVVSRRLEFAAVSMSTYGLLLLSLYGEPLKYFAVGLAAFVTSIIVIAFFADATKNL